MDAYPSAEQRAPLATFAEALSSAVNASRRDECGDPRTLGRRGHVYAVPGGFQLYCVSESKQAWNEEGCLFMDRPPTEDEAAAIRDYLSIAKRPDLSEAERERRRSFGERSPWAVEPAA